ncbi:HTH_Tnp_Tc3_2 domain-containing protein [Trichonephila clavipes]|nr:HTH_Tnp_Tc3_2 domain-containing protein [Trichonephila clavipes]
MIRRNPIKKKKDVKASLALCRCPVGKMLTVAEEKVSRTGYITFSELSSPKIELHHLGRTTPGHPWYFERNPGGSFKIMPRKYQTAFSSFQLRTVSQLTVACIKVAYPERCILTAAHRWHYLQWCKVHKDESMETRLAYGNHFPLSNDSQRQLIWRPDDREETAGWSTRRVAGQVDRSEYAVRNCWEQWTREGTHARKIGSGATRKTTRREDRRIVRQALVDPTVTRLTIRTDVGVAIVPQTISWHLAEANLKSKNPFRALPLTPEHRQLRLQWCQAR